MTQEFDHPIAQSLHPSSQHVVDVLGDVWLRTGRWPVFDYLHRRLAQDFDEDALQVVGELPMVQGQSPHTVYRLVFSEIGGSFGDPERRIGLTIAGLHHVAAAAPQVSQLVLVIRHLADADHSLVPDIDRSVSLDLPVLDLLSDALRDDLRGWREDTLAAALEHEPSLWGGVSPATNRIRVQAGRLARFRGVADANDYIRRVVEMIGWSARPARLGQTPVMGLPDAFGYLDAIWRARFGTRLLGFAEPSSWARLALPASSVDELNSRLSALSDVFARFEVAPLVDSEPDGKKTAGTLVRLSEQLKRDLAPEAHERVETSVQTLQRIARIRVGAQHSGLSAEVVQAFRELDIRYPPTDPAAAWGDIGAVAVQAINAIREEIQADRLPAPAP